MQSAEHSSWHPQCCYPSKAGFDPVLEWRYPSWVCPALSRKWVCSASLSLTTLVSALFEILVFRSAPAPEKASHQASCRRPLLLMPPSLAPPAPACSAAGREAPAAGNTCPWALAKPHKRAGQGSTLPSNLAEWAGGWQEGVDTAWG